MQPKHSETGTSPNGIGRRGVVQEEKVDRVQLGIDQRGTPPASVNKVGLILRIRTNEGPDGGILTGLAMVLKPLRPDRTEKGEVMDAGFAGQCNLTAVLSRVASEQRAINVSA